MLIISQDQVDHWIFKNWKHKGETNQLTSLPVVHQQERQHRNKSISLEIRPRTFTAIASSSPPSQKLPVEKRGAWKKHIKPENESTSDNVKSNLYSSMWCKTDKASSEHSGYRSTSITQDQNNGAVRKMWQLSAWELSFHFSFRERFSADEKSSSVFAAGSGCE